MLTADRVAAAMARGGPAEREPTGPARFAVGDRVRTRAGRVDHHTRLPGYVAGQVGTIERVHGAHVFPDTNAHDLGEQPEWLYTVVFDATDLWDDADARPAGVGRRLGVVPVASRGRRIVSGQRPRCCRASRIVDGEPVFREPWEAHAFAMAVRLHEQGLFTWPQWAATLAEEIERRPGRRRPRHGRHLLPPLARRPRTTRRGNGRRVIGRSGTNTPSMAPRRRSHTARPPDRTARRRLPGLTLIRLGGVPRRTVR